MPVISVRVDRHTYEALVKMAEARGVSLYSLVKRILEAQVSSEVSGEVSCQVSSEVSYRELERKLSELTSKVSYLEEKIQELLTSVASKNTTGKVTSTTNPSATQSKAGTEERTGASTNEGYEWCRSKAKIRNLQNFLKWVDDSFGLVDWWDEGDRYCFKTRSKPAKTE